MDFSGAVKWGIRIVTAAAIISGLLFVLSAITLPVVATDNILSAFDVAVSMFYYYVPSASILFPLMLSMWGLSFVILATEYAMIGLRTIWKTSE